MTCEYHWRATLEYAPGESPEEKWRELSKDARAAWRIERRLMLERGCTALDIAREKSRWLTLKFRFFEGYCPPILLRLKPGR